MKAKRFITGIIAVCMAMALPGVSYAVSTSNVSEFPDVTKARADYSAIIYMKATGLISGYPDGTFKPDQAVNRVEALKMIMGIEDFNYWMHAEDGPIFSGVKKEITMTDIDKNAWYISYLQQAYNDDLVKGYPDGTFRPERTINKVEAVKILLEHTFLRIDSLDDVTIVGKPFADAELNQWYTPYVQYAKDKNILPIGSSDTINPDGAITRGKLAQLIYNDLIADGQTFDAKNITVELNETTGGHFVVYNQNFWLAALPGAYTENDEIEASLTKVTDDYAYISVCATGFGGYILYSFCEGNNYRVNLLSGDVSQLDVEVSGIEHLDYMDVSPDEHKTAWADRAGNKIFLLPTGDSDYVQSFNVDAKYTQFGDVKFSPDGSKIAYAASLGQGNGEESAIYIISLADGVQTEFKAQQDGIFWVHGWENNETVQYSWMKCIECSP